jgi:hypothetical protein
MAIHSLVNAMYTEDSTKEREKSAGVKKQYSGGKKKFKTKKNGKNNKC